MGKKVKFKVKKGKLKVKLKSGDDGALALSEKDLRGLLVLAMASAVEPPAGGDTLGVLTSGAAIDSPTLLVPGNVSNDEPSSQR